MNWCSNLKGKQIKYYLTEEALDIYIEFIPKSQKGLFWILDKIKETDKKGINKPETLAEIMYDLDTLNDSILESVVINKLNQPMFQERALGKRPE